MKFLWKLLRRNLREIRTMVPLVNALCDFGGGGWNLTTVHGFAGHGIALCHPAVIWLDEGGTQYFNPWNFNLLAFQSALVRTATGSTRNLRNV